MRKRADVIVVGGGVIGCSIAYYLGRIGIKALVLERGHLGMGASGAAAGMLAPLAESNFPGAKFDLALKGFNLVLSLVKELEEETGIDLEFSKPGILRAAFDESVETELKGLLEWQGKLGMGVGG